MLHLTGLRVELVIEDVHALLQAGQTGTQINVAGLGVFFSFDAGQLFPEWPQMFFKQ